MAIQTFPTVQNNDFTGVVSLFMTGLSTDVKPIATVPPNSLFIETDTANAYIFNGSEWSTPTSKKTIKGLNDLPTPVDGVITLLDNTTYQISGTVDIGTNRIIVGAKNTIFGVDKQNDILTSNTTGVFFTLDSSITNKGSLTFSTLGLKCPNGTMFSVTSVVQRNVLIIDNCNLQTIVNMGTLNNFISFAIRNSSFQATGSGIVTTGINGSFTVRDNIFRTVSNICFDLGVSTFNTIDFSRNVVNTDIGETFLKGTALGANIIIGSQFHNNILSGLGTYLDTIGINDTGWLFKSNTGVSDSAGGSGPQGFQGNQGFQGAVGIGAQGNQGFQGLQGAIGTTGVQGFQGLQGAQGLQGLQGNQGFQGDQGFQGFQGSAALGDVIGQASSVDSEIALFSGAGGKTIKRSSTTGILKATSGVIASAVVGTDYGRPYTHVSTSSGATTTGANVTPVDVSGAVFTYVQNAVYRIWVMGRINSTAATTGVGIHFNVSTAITDINVLTNHPLTTSTPNIAYSISDDVSEGVTTGVPAGPLDVPFITEALLRPGNNTGTCQLRLRSETTAVTELLAGVTMVVERLS